MNSRLVPELVPCLKKGYTRSALAHDVMAGVIVGIVALPLAIAFAIASGVKPEQGLFTAVIAGLLISVLSGSRVQIGGPTGAFIVVVASIVAQHGYGGLAVATVMAGLLLVCMGMARLGGVIKFIPYPMTVGFTSGIALIIATTQIKDFLGLTIPKPSSEFLEKMVDYGRHAGTLNPSALLVGGISLVIIVLWPRVTKRVPGSIVAILAGTALTHLFDLPVATIGSQFGSVPSQLPMPAFPEFDWHQVPKLISPAFTIAMLAAIESLLSAVVADGMTGMRHRSNMELVAQGVANIASPLFGGIPATGAIARTATNIKNGGRTPLAGIVHAVTLLLILMCFGQWATLIPMATLAAVLLVVSYHMSEWRHFVKLLRAPRADVLVMVTTFALTVFIDLTVAIEVGVVLSALLFMHRMASATEIRHLSREFNDEYDEVPGQLLRAGDIPEGVEVFEIRGPFFFGAATQFKDTVGLVETPPKVLILHLEHILSLDATAIHSLEELVQKARRDKTKLLLSGIHARPLDKLHRTGLSARIGRKRIFARLDTALAEARRLVEEDAKKRAKAEKHGSTPWSPGGAPLGAPGH